MVWHYYSALDMNRYRQMNLFECLDIFSAGFSFNRYRRYTHQSQIQTIRTLGHTIVIDSIGTDHIYLFNLFLIYVWIREIYGDHALS